MLLKIDGQRMDREILEFHRPFFEVSYPTPSGIVWREASSKYGIIDPASRSDEWINFFTRIANIQNERLAAYCQGRLDLSSECTS